jgi:hypothetical protein
MVQVLEHEDGYTIVASQMKEGEVITCPDNKTQIEKVTPDSVVLTLLKGKLKKGPHSR